MLTLDDPELQAMLCTAPVAVVADYLSDRGCALPDVLRLFAGTPPHHVDGIGKEVLVAWLRVNCDRMVSDDHPGRVGTCCLLSDLVDSVRESEALFTRTMASDRELRAATPENGGSVLGHDVAVEAATRRATAVVTRGMKRRVLKLFPDVAVAVPDIRPPGLLAPYLIPPEPIRDLVITVPVAEYVVDAAPAEQIQVGSPLIGTAQGMRLARQGEGTEAVALETPRDGRLRVRLF